MQNRIKPFVKWAGGKGNILDKLSKFYPVNLKMGNIECYIEPFIGGGAVMLDILQMYRVNEFFAFDTNIDLINSYNVIKENVEELIDELRKLEENYLCLEKEERKEYYYSIRDKYNLNIIAKNDVSISKASQFIFLNRTCFNGLYRVNKNGDFNVPMGNYNNPKICDSQNLRALSNLVKNVVFECGDYSLCEKYIKENTFIYFDPPYRPLNITSSFTSYTKEEFDDIAQKELATFYKNLNDKYNIKLMLSNSNPKNSNKDDNFFEEIYNGFYINEVFAKRMINSISDKRGEISDLLITNYEANI